MSSTGNEAIAKAPTIEDEMAKFKGFSTQDGETSNGESKSAADERAAAEEQEAAAAESNQSTHAENQARANAQPAARSAKVELTAEEEEAAIQDATDAKGEQLTEEEADEAVGKALADKEKNARKEQHKKDANSRIGELTRHRRAAERRAEAAEARSADLERRLAALERGERPLTNDKSADKKDTQGDKPDHTNAEKYPYGELDAQYISDLAVWKVQQGLKADAEGKKTQEKDQQDEAAVAAFKTAVAAFEEAGEDQFDDFHEVVMADRDGKAKWPCSPTLGEMILESDHGPAIAYALASDIEEAKRIHGLTKSGQAKWFARKEDELSAGSAASTAKSKDQEGEPHQAEARTKRNLPQPRTSKVRESKAPIPLSRSGGANGNRMPSPATTDFAAFEAMARGQHK